MQISDYLTIEALDHIDGDVGVGAFGHMGAEDTVQFDNHVQDVVVRTTGGKFVKDAMVMLVDAATNEPYHQVKTDESGLARFSVQIPVGRKLAYLIKNDPRLHPTALVPATGGGEAALIEVKAKKVGEQYPVITYGIAALIGGVVLYNLVKKI